MNEQQVAINSWLIAIFGIVLTALIALWVRSSTAKNTRLSELEAKVTKLELDSAVTDTKLTPIWARVQSEIISQLHHPHFKSKEMDKLLDTLDGKTDEPLTGEERARLKVLCKERAVDKSPEITDDERASALIMGTVMDKMSKEAASLEVGEIVDVGLVGSVAIPEPKDNKELPMKIHDDK